MTSTAKQTNEQIVAQLSQEFLTYAGERIGVIENALGTGSNRDSEVIMIIRRESHNIKGTGGSFGFPVVGLIAHRLEDYISGLDELDERHVSDIAVFLDCLLDIIEIGWDPDDSAAEALVRSLPAHPDVDTELSNALDIEILLVSPSKTISVIAVQTLRGSGYHVTTARSAVEALEFAVRTRPDLIITSAAMAGVSGIDLVRALRVITATRELPVAVLTSFSIDHQELNQIPSDVPVIRLGESFDKDLTKVITGFGFA